MTDASQITPSQWDAIGAYIKDQQAREQLAAMDPATRDAMFAYLGSQPQAPVIPPVEQPAPTELAAWGNQRAQLGTTYNQTLAQLEYQRQNDLANFDLASQQAALQEQMAGARHSLDTGHLSASHNLSLADLTRNKTNTLADLTKQFARARDAFDGPMARRGVLNSGIYTNALGQFNADKNDAFTRANQGYDSQLARLNEDYNYGTQSSDLSYQQAQAAFQMQQQQAALQHQQALAGLTLTGTQAGQTYKTAMGAVDATEAARRQELATAIKAF